MAEKKFGSVLLSIAAAARVLGISGSGVRRLIRSGQLPTVEVGDSVRIPMPAIERLVSTEAPAGEPGAVRAGADLLAAVDELRWAKRSSSTRSPRCARRSAG
jgi:excisionase family DNA binding protein